MICFFDTAQGKPLGQTLTHSSVIISVAINQQGIAPDRQVHPPHSDQAQFFVHTVAEDNSACCEVDVHGQDDIPVTHPVLSSIAAVLCQQQTRVLFVCLKRMPGSNVACVCWHVELSKLRLQLLTESNFAVMLCASCDVVRQL